MGACGQSQQEASRGGAVLQRDACPELRTQVGGSQAEGGALFHAQSLASSSARLPPGSHVAVVVGGRSVDGSGCVVDAQAVTAVRY